MSSLILIAPEIGLTLLALGILTAEVFAPRVRTFWIRLAVIGLLAALAHQLIFFVTGAVPGAESLGISPINVKGGWVEYPLVYGMISADSLAAFFKLGLLAAVILILWLSIDYREFKESALGTYAALMLLATVGMMLMVESTDLLLTVLALELLSIASFILVGYAAGRKSSSEGAVKYFLVGTLSTALFLYGTSFYYAYFGTTGIQPLLQLAAGSSGSDLTLMMVLVFLLSGIGFKLAMVPFHMWAPDAYEGAPTPITAFLSVAPKAAAVGFLLRLLGHHDALGITPLLAVIAAVTMTVGNVGALQQTNMKRMLAYSSIAQIGYILVAFVAGGSLGTQAVMLYTFLYLFMNLGVFAVLVTVSNQTHSDEVPTFAGLYQKSMGLSLVMLLFLLSLTGIPPLAGFIGKFTIFAAVLTHPSLLWLAIVAVLNSVISLFYYFRIVQQMFFKEPADPIQPRYSASLVCCLGVTLFITVATGLFPDRILAWVRNVIGS